MEDNKKSKDSKEVEFKDFKKSISKGEFKAVLEVCNSEYEKLRTLASSQEEFNQKVNESLLDIQNQSEGMPPGLADKLLQGIRRKANKEITNSYGDIIERHLEITDFINRFKTPGEEMPYITLNFKYN